jgi:hypothetical protein
MALMRVLLAIFILAIQGQAQDNRCDNGPCKIGCCNEFGWCGFGPKCKSSKFQYRLFIWLTIQSVVPTHANQIVNVNRNVTLALDQNGRYETNVL